MVNTSSWDIERSIEKREHTLLHWWYISYVLWSWSHLNGSSNYCHDQTGYLVLKWMVYFISAYNRQLITFKLAVTFEYIITLFWHYWLFIWFSHFYRRSVLITVLVLVRALASKYSLLFAFYDLTAAVSVPFVWWFRITKIRMCRLPALHSHCQMLNELISAK